MLLKEICCGLIILTLIKEVQMHCATTITEWDERAKLLHCDVSKLKTYHCILNLTQDPVELCMVREVIKSGEVGCPWINMRKTVPIFGYPLLDCNVSQCPSPTHKGYYTDMLYQYPACFEKQENRTSSRKSEAKGTTTANNPSLNVQSPSAGTVNPVLLVIIGVLIAGFICIVYIIFHKRGKRRRRSSDNHPDESNELLHNKEDGGFGFEDLKQRDLAKQNAPSEHRSGTAQQLDFVVNGESIIETFIPTTVTKKLKEILERKNAAWLCGICGSGKTHAALWYGLECRKESSRSITWKISCDNMKNMFSSMKTFCTYWKGETLVSETEQISDTDICAAAEAILEKLNLSGKHVIVFEGVAAEVVTPLLKVVKIMQKNYEIRFILTTQDRNVFSSAKQEIFVHDNLIDSFRFSEEEAFAFFTVDHTEDRESVNRLANHLCFFPFAMKSAQSYMESSKLSAKAMCELLVETKSQTSLFPQDINIDLFQPLENLVNIIRDSEPSAYELLTYIQFFEPHGIPAYIFTFLQTEKKLKEAEMATNKFLQILQKFSFAKVRGRDDKREVDANSALRVVMKEMVSGDEKKTRSAKVMECFTYFLCNKLYPRSDIQKSIALLPHARHALSVAERIESVTPNTLLWKIILTSNLACICKLSGQLSKSESYAESALTWCYEMIETKSVEQGTKSFYTLMKEENLELSLSTVDTVSKSLTFTFEKRLEKRLKKCTKDDLKEMKKSINNYKRRKFRHQNEISLFQSKVESICKKRPHLLDDIETLKSRGYVLDINDSDLCHLFIYEAVIDAFLTFGLFVLTDKMQLSDEDKAMMIVHVKIAHLIAQNLQTKFKGFPLYCALKCEVHGTMELTLHEPADDFDIKEEKVEDLTTMKSKMETLLKEPKIYFLGGVCFTKTNDTHFYLACTVQVLKLCKLISETTEIKTVKETYDKQASSFANKLDNFLLCKDNFVTPKSQEVKQCVVRHFMEKEDYSSALRLLEEVQHFDYRKPKPLITPDDINDLILICQCYKVMKNEENLKSIREHINGNVWKNLITFEFPETNKRYKTLLLESGSQPT